MTWHAFLPLWVGGLLVGLALAVLTYFATYQVLVICRRKVYALHLQRIDRKRRRREARAKATRSQAKTDPTSSKHN